jgi:hypothetical protein
MSEENRIAIGCTTLPNPAESPFEGFPSADFFADSATERTGLTKDGTHQTLLTIFQPK